MRKETCPECNGRGNMCEHDGSVFSARPCKLCKGKKVIVDAKTYCICGAEMEMIHTNIIDSSDLGCYWLQCNSCGRRGTPAIMEHDAKWYWVTYKNAMQGRGKRQ